MIKNNLINFKKAKKERKTFIKQKEEIENK